MATMLSPGKRRCMNGAGVFLIALVLVAGMTGCSDCAPEEEVAVATDEMKYEQGAKVAHSKEFRIAEDLEPLITVISPDEGAQWVIGEAYDIIWESRGIEEVDVYLGEPPPPTLPKPLYTKIVAGVPAARGAYSWTIPDETSPREDVWIAVVRAGFHPLAYLPDYRPEGFVIGRSASFRIVHERSVRTVVGSLVAVSVAVAVFVLVMRRRGRGPKRT